MEDDILILFANSLEMAKKLSPQSASFAIGRCSGLASAYNLSNPNNSNTLHKVIQAVQARWLSASI